jgi:hypothetical protein
MATWTNPGPPPPPPKPAKGLLAPGFLIHLAMLVIGVSVLRFSPDRSRFTTTWAWGITIWGGLALLLLGVVRALHRFSPEAMARSIFGRQKEIYAGAHEHRIVGPEALAGFDVDFYTQTQAAFEALGFRHLADGVDETMARIYPDLRTVSRTMVTDAGDAIAAFWQIVASKSSKDTPEQAAKRKSMELITELSDGTSVWTFSGERSDTTTDWPWVRRQFTGRSASPADLLEHHRRTVATMIAEDPSRRIVPRRTLQDLLESSRRSELRQGAYKRQQGYIGRAELERILGSPLKPVHEEVAAEVERLRAEVLAEVRRGG